jgi:hypothetical protein
MLSGGFMSPQFSQTRDISAEGAFVELGENSLVYGAKIEMALSIQKDKGNSVYKIPARVMRVTEGGVGLKFEGLDVDAYSVVLGLLYAA